MSFLDQLVGKKPQVPDLPPLSLSTEQQKALAANLNALPQAEQIATKVDLFNQQQIDQMLGNVIPNYKAITGNISKNIEALTAGQIPSDVSAAVQQNAAARALGGGYAGTGSGRNLVARDLGLTSLDLTAKGLASAESWMKTAASIYEPGMFNISSMFVTPGQMAQFDVNERQSQFQRQWMRNQIEAMPAPWAEDLKQFVYRAMSAYSGTPVQANPYSTPGSFGGGFEGGGGGGGMNFSGPSVEPGGYGEPFSASSGAMEGDFGAGFGGGGGGIAAMIA